MKKGDALPMALPRSIRHPLRRFAQVGNRRRVLAVEAVVCLAVARLALVIVPFPKLARRLGTAIPPQNAHANSEADPRAVGIAQDIGWAVTRAARYLPFSAVCLPQALAARMMLKRRGVGSVLHFGATTQAQRIKAHAWLDAAGVKVTGYPVAKEFVEIARFV